MVINYDQNNYKIEVMIEFSDQLSQIISL